MKTSKQKGRVYEKNITVLIMIKENNLKGQNTLYDLVYH